MTLQPVGRIAPVVPSPSILTSARPLPAVDWRSGIAWTPVCQQSFALEECPAAIDREAAGDRDTVGTSPFTIYTPMSCDGMGATASDTAREDAQAIVEQLTEVHTAWGIARALWLGEGLVDEVLVNGVMQAPPTLRNSAMDVSQAAPVDLDDGVASLLAHYELCTGGSGGAVIHMPTNLLPFALGGGGGGARVCWPEGTVYRTAAGALVSPGPGYPIGFTIDGPDGAGPGVPGNFAGNEPGTAWIYVSGPVEYAVGDVTAVPEAERDRIPFRTNIYELWGERRAIVRFDPCCVFAIEVLSNVVLPEVS